MKPYATIPASDGAAAQPDAPDDDTLVAGARQGDEAAFYELVRRHRARACGIARSLTRDDHLAEDIVQEALVRAFLQLGTLADNRKFLPWFHRIVRTQAWMKLRRGGWNRRETPFSGIIVRPLGVSGNEPSDSVEAVVPRLRERADERARTAEDPAAWLVRKEMLESIWALLGCLNRRERDIFEAHFFSELSPAEIAEWLGTTTGYVYTSLSRTKAKLRAERLRVYVNGYVRQRRARGLPVRRMLDSSMIHFK